jgi:23S rRNA pseudouridine2605 synthase
MAIGYMSAVRLQKFLAEAGVASRRASEQIILAGRVTINGRASRELGVKIQPGRDEVAVDGVAVKARRKIYVAINKPPDFLCTRSDPEKRSTVADLLPQEWRHLAPVGRLDRDSEGLLFLTNDGEFALRLTHPRYGVHKIYLATVEGRALPRMTSRLLAGIEDCGELLKAERARVLSSNNSHSVLELELGEGKNREVRRMLAALDLNVIRLQRIQIGRIKLGQLPLGKWRTLTEPEIKSLLSPL